MRRRSRFFLAFFLFSCSGQVDERIQDSVANKEVVQEMQADTNLSGVERHYYPGGELEEEIEYDEHGAGFRYTFYYPNGNIKMSGEQGEMQGCLIAQGNELYFDSTGTLVQKIAYEHFLPDLETCHEIRTVKAIEKYYSNGSLSESGNMETCYECDECPCGDWKFYNVQGKLTRSENHGDCYDSQLGCVE